MNLLYQNNMIVMDTRVILVTFYNLKWIIFIFFFLVLAYMHLVWMLLKRVVLFWESQKFRILKP